MVITHETNWPNFAPNQRADASLRPINHTTTITYSLRTRSHVTLRVYNVAGQLVRTLVDDIRTPGVSYRAEWDGRNAAGEAVSSGVYFYRIVTSEFTKTRKMVLLK